MGEDIGLVKAPRLCKMQKEEAGFGFNLHGEKGVIGQYISAVDPGGPADLSGICIGDRVVEVNGENVENLSHADVVTKIRSRRDATALLVIDKVTDSYLQKIGMPVTVDLVGYSSVYEIKMTDENIESNLSNLSIQSDDHDTGKDITDSIPSQDDLLKKDSTFPHTESSPIEQYELGSPVEPSNLNQSAKFSSDLSHNNNKPTPVKPPRVSPKASPQVSKKTVELEGSTILPNASSQSPAVNDEKPQKSDEFSPSSPIKARPQSIPKRKQVKENKADWKSKQSLFDQL